jgi:hypothetical protein
MGLVSAANQLVCINSRKQPKPSFDLSADARTVANITVGARMEGEIA